MPRDFGESLYDVLTGDDEGRACRDIPDSACREQPRNFLLQALSLAATKTGDGLADAKLVLPWLLTALGAPASAIGLLVPVREALALLPQLLISAQIRGLPLRKWAWVAGSIVQGLAVLAMTLAVLTQEGAAAGWTVVALLAVFATARSVASISHKDVLGKTVDKQRRGTVTGVAGTVSAGLVLAFGVALATGFVPLTVTSLALALMVAGALWLLAALLFAGLVEEPGATEGGANGIRDVLGQFRLLADDAQLRRFIAVRGLLIGTALAPPYLLALTGADGGAELGELGLFVIAAGIATLTSAYVWGRFADRSSRQVLITAALLGAVATAAAATLGPTAPLVLPLLLFVLLVAHQGVRLGRTTHLVDMAGKDDRAAYTALANTTIGLLLLLGGAFGLMADAQGVPPVLATFTVMALAAAWLARGLAEVQT
ncbi:MAG: MFS transporter [Geminicoccaceae bacterium]|nr:MAG: MFS transporter [Geminicoccaceae bacterium]